LKAGWLRAFQERTLPKKNIRLADQQAKQLIEIIRRPAATDEVRTERRWAVAFQPSHSASSGAMVIRLPCLAITVDSTSG